MTLKFVIILQNLIKAYHRKSGKSKYDRIDRTRCRDHTDPVPCERGLTEHATDYVMVCYDPDKLGKIVANEILYIVAY